MKKTIAITAVLVLAAALLLPGLFAGSIEDTIKSVHEQSVEGSPLTVEVVSYDRNWFGSTATVRVTDPSDAMAPLVGVLDIEHGPFAGGLSLASVRSEYRFETTNEGYAEIIGTQPFAVDNATITLGGNIKGNVKFFSFEGMVEDTNNHLTFKDTTLAYEFSPATNALSTEIDFGTMKLSGDDFSFDVGDVHLSSYSADITKLISEGESSFVMRNASAVHQGKNMSVEEARSEAEIVPVEALYSIISKTAVKGLTVDGQLYPEGIYDVSLINLNGDAINSMSEFFESAMLNPGPDMASKGQFEVLVKELLAASPALILDNVRQSTPNGVVQATGKATFNGAGAFLLDQSSIPRISANLDLLVDKAVLENMLGTVIRPRAAMMVAMQHGSEKAEDEAFIDAQAAQQVSQTLARATQQNLLLVNADGQYQIDVKFQQGAPSINGHPPAALMQALSQ